MDTRHILLKHHHHSDQGVLDQALVVWKRSSQVTLSQFDDNVYIKEDPSIATTFDPEKDKSLYDTALGLYRQFSNSLDSDDMLNDDLKKNY